MYDIKGSNGKTELMKELISNHNFELFGNAETKHIADAWDGGNCVFDLPREQEQAFNYSALENLKDGSIFSQKFHSKAKQSKHKIHVFVFANFLPETKKMTPNKWDIRTLDLVNGERILTKLTLPEVKALQIKEKIKEKLRLELEKTQPDLSENESRAEMAREKLMLEKEQKKLTKNN
jgi:hypothetical protein